VVPSGATTGPISVTVGNYTGKSTASFTVTGLTGTSPATTGTRYLQVLTSKGVHDASYFYFTAPSATYWPIGATPAPPPGGVSYPQPLKPDLFQVIDINGDGLADVVFGALDTTSNNNSAVFYYQLNNGVGNSATPFATAACVISGCPQNYGASQFTVGDYDGDGKGDVWIVPTDANHNCLSANCEYTVYESSGSGFTQAVASPLYANDIHPTDPSSFTFQLDFDGDGYADTLMINPNDSSLNKNWGTRRLNTHHQARNVISKVTSGLGAITNIDYAPLTFNSVYYREYNGWQTYSGWGAPVQDVLTPRYAVQYVDSSAPTSSNTAATSRVRYRYGGYKVQGYGRGPLGFHTIYTTDQQTNTETVTTYNQAYPLTGTPQQTVAYKNADSTADACLTTPDSASCMLYSNAPPTFAGVAVLSKTTDTWAWHPRGSTSTYTTVSAGVLTTAMPIDLMHSGSSAFKYGLDGALFSSSSVNSTYSINSLGESYGELATSTTSDYSSATQSPATTLRQTKITNQYLADKDVAPTSANGYQAIWHLGRLSSATTTATPWVSGVADSVHAITRASAFDYDATTGLLTGEHLQPSGSSDQVLHKYHFRDAKGNETESVTCGATAVCSASAPLTAAGVTFKSTDTNWVQRYSRTAYDASGIYPTASYAPFSNGSTGATEYTTLNVLARDAFGNITDSTDAHGVETRSYFGALGRQYFSTTNTGGAVQTIYRWCSGYQPSGVATVVYCPSGAAYRVDSLANAGGTARAPESWTYFDVLAREVLKVQQGFAAAQYIAVRKDYDNLGRVAHVTEPYFTYAPTTATVGNANGVSIYQTTTGYDVLGRVTSITHPNNSQTTTVYSNLDTAITLPANASSIKQTKKETRNLLGQVVTITDYYNTTLTNTYDVTGNVLTVKRASSTQNATVTMTYDALGRKKTLSDPDLGNWTYSYNALGEQVQSKSGTSCTNSSFDGQGRVYTKSDYANGTCAAPADVSATWSFDTASYGVGELAQATSSDNGTSSTRTPVYDSFGRASQSTTAIGTVSYVQRSTYDQFGRTYQGFFSGTNITETGELYLYNPQGYAYQTQDGENGTVGQIYRQITAMDQRGNATTEVRANNATLTTTRTYDQPMGWLTGINTASGTLQNLTYTYDALGNQQTRSDTSNGASVSETFGYDGLQRLLTQSGSTTASWAYDSFGNPAGATYGTKATNCTNTPGPDAISSTATNQYCYDTRGNQTSVLNGSGSVLSTATYTADDKLRQAVTQNGLSTHTTKWAYGPERARLARQDYPNATGTGTPTLTHYIGDAEIINAGTATPTVKRYLPGLILSKTGATLSYEYLFTDNLGSTHRITDQSGNVYANGAQRFTAFGQRASSANDAPLAASAQYTFNDSLTHHGFTGHEQMDESGLVHMNGRIYAPGTMRFTSPDPFVQDPSDVQSYNRYSYVLNNPLVHTDPSGYWNRKDQGYLRAAAAIAITAGTAWYLELAEDRRQAWNAG